MKFLLIALFRATFVTAATAVDEQLTNLLRDLGLAEDTPQLKPSPPMNEEQHLFTSGPAEQTEDCDASIATLNEKMGIFNRLIDNLTTPDEFMKDLAATKNTLDLLKDNSFEEHAFMKNLADIGDLLPSDLFSKKYHEFTENLDEAYHPVLEATVSPPTEDVPISRYRKFISRLLCLGRSRSTENLNEVQASRHEEFIEKLRLARDACRELIKLLTEMSELYAKIGGIAQTISSVIENDIQSWYSTITFENGVAVDQVVMFFSNPCYAHS